MPQDLQSLPLPVFLHEPTTELMKAAEDVEHSHLLDEARRSRQPVSPAFIHTARFEAIERMYLRGVLSIWHLRPSSARAR